MGSQCYTFCFPYDSISLQAINFYIRNIDGKQGAQGLCLASDIDSLSDQTLTRLFGAFFPTGPHHEPCLWPDYASFQKNPAKSVSREFPHPQHLITLVFWG